MPRVQLLLCFTLLFASVTLLDVVSAHLKYKPTLPDIEPPQTIDDVEPYTIKVVMIFVSDLEKECPKTSKFKSFFARLRGFARYVVPIRRKGQSANYDQDMEAKQGSLIQAISSFAIGRIKEEIIEEKNDAIKTFRFMKSIAGRIMGRGQKTEASGKLTTEQQTEIKAGILKWETVITRIANTMVISEEKSSSSSESTSEESSSSGSKSSGRGSSSSKSEGSASGSMSEESASGSESEVSASVSKNEGSSSGSKKSEGSSSKKSEGSSSKKSEGSASGSKSEGSSSFDDTTGSASNSGSPSESPSSSESGSSSKTESKSGSKSAEASKESTGSKSVEASTGSESAEASNESAEASNGSAEASSGSTSSKSVETSSKKTVTVQQVETESSKEIMMFLMNLEKKCPPKEEYKSFFEKLKSTMTGSTTVTKKRRGIFGGIKAAAGKLSDAMLFIRSRLGSKSAEVKRNMEAYQAQIIKTMQELDTIHTQILRENKGKSEAALTCTPEQQTQIKQTITKWEQVTTQFVEVAVQSESSSSSSSSTSSSSSSSSGSGSGALRQAMTN